MNENRVKNFLVYGGSGYVGSRVVSQLKNNGHYVIATWAHHEPTANLLPLASWVQSDFTSKEGFLKLETVLNLSHEFILDGVIFCVSARPQELFMKNQNNQNNQNNQKFNYPQCEQVDYDLFRELLEIYSIGIHRGIRLALPFLKRSVNPNVVVMGSLSGLKSVFAPATFAIAKSSIRGLVESLSKELGNDNIKINSVDPGILAEGSASGISDELKSDYLKHCALKRFGTAEEVSDMICWLASENSYITGKPIVLDGGL